MKKLIFAFALPLLAMILCSCASEEHTTTTTTTTTNAPQRPPPPPPDASRPSGMMRGGMGG